MPYLVYFIFFFCFFFFNDTATTEIYTLSLHDALPIPDFIACFIPPTNLPTVAPVPRSEEHTSELQSRPQLVCRLLLEKKKKLKRNASENLKKYHNPTIIIKISNQ